MKGGVKPIRYKDHRTYDFHRTFGSLPITGKEEFNFDTVKVFPDQNADGSPNGCTSYTQNDIASNEDRVYYDDHLFTYNNTKLIMGVEGEVPCDMLSALKAPVVYGVKSLQMTAEQALDNRRAPYFIVRPLGDYFDGLISAMMTKEGCLSLATPWFPEFEQTGSDGITPLPKDFNENRASWHNWEACGVKVIGGVQYIIAKSWQGSTFGDKGYNYFSRAHINQLLSTQGAGAFGQKHAQPSDIKNVQMTIIETIISFIRMILDKLSKGMSGYRATLNYEPPVDPPKVMEPILPAQAEVPVVHDDSWCGGPLADRLAMYDLAVRVCKEEGLFPSMTRDLLATVYGESGWNQWCVNHNTKDYGIAQFSAKYYLVEYKMTPQEALEQPEKCLRIMAKNFKAGRQSNWVAYATRQKYFDKKPS